MAQIVKNLSAIGETWVQSLDQEDPLEKGMASHSSILAWRIPWTEEPGWLQSTGLQIVRHDWATITFTLPLWNQDNFFNSCAMYRIQVGRGGKSYGSPEFNSFESETIHLQNPHAKTSIDTSPPWTGSQGHVWPGRWTWSWAHHWVKQGPHFKGWGTLDGLGTSFFS